MRPDRFLLALLLTGFVPVAVQAQTRPAASATPADHGVFTPADIVWKDGPPSLPAGMKLAVLEGDLAKEGPFTVRVKMPDGYRIPAHWHSKVEHLTVISGTFNLGFGEALDTKSGHEMPTGTFAFMPAGMRHYAWTKGETILQVHAVGPWDINYVKPEDDPRKK